MGNVANGKKLCLLIGGYMVVKSVVNLILGLGAANFLWLIVNIGLAYALIQAVPKFNYVTGGFLALLFLMNVKNNIAGHHWFYLGEGIIDAVCAAALFVNKDIKEYIGRN